jgi:hypothetical protein
VFGFILIFTIMGVASHKHSTKDSKKVYYVNELYNSFREDASAAPTFFSCNVNNFSTFFTFSFCYCNANHDGHLISENICYANLIISQNLCINTVAIRPLFCTLHEELNNYEIIPGATGSFLSAR